MGLLSVGQLYGQRYLVERLLGQGGQGETYLIRDRHERDLPKVAKLAFPGELARQGDDHQRVMDKAARALESELLGRSIRSPYIIRLYGIDRECFITPSYRVALPALLMEYLEDARRLDFTALSDDESGRLDLYIRICEGVAACHAAGIVHRDLSPDNILVIRDAAGTLIPVLIDFGTARQVLDGATGWSGKPKYAPPDPLPRLSAANDARRAIAPSWDIWSVGVIFAELECRQHPFNALMDEVAQFDPRASLVLLQRLLGQRSPELGGVQNPRLRLLIERCLSPQPGDRPTAMELVASLRAEFTWIVSPLREREKVLEQREAKLASYVAQLDERAAEMEDRAAVLANREQVCQRKAGELECMARELAVQQQAVGGRETMLGERESVIAQREARTQRLELLADLPEELLRGLAAAMPRRPDGRPVGRSRLVTAPLLGILIGCLIGSAGIGMVWRYAANAQAHSEPRRDPQREASSVTDSPPRMHDPARGVSVPHPKGPALKPSVPPSPSVPWVALGPAPSTPRIMLKPVTVADYRQAMGQDPAHWDDGSCYIKPQEQGQRSVKAKLPPELREPGRPLVCIDWVSANAFCEKIGGLLPNVDELTQATGHAAQLGLSTPVSFEWTGDCAGASSLSPSCNTGSHRLTWDVARTQVSNPQGAGVDEVTSARGFRCVRSSTRGGP